jgi:hypothetical protein
MHRIRKPPDAGARCFPALARALSTLLLLAAGPVLARQCPRGQILRVSKNICVAKGEAVGGHVYYGSTFHGPTRGAKSSPEREPESQSADLQPAAGAAEADRPPAPIPAKKPRPPSPALSPSASPYGELSLESFPKP